MKPHRLDRAFQNINKGSSQLGEDFFMIINLQFLTNFLLSRTYTSSIYVRIQSFWPHIEILLDDFLLAGIRILKSLEQTVL